MQEKLAEAYRAIGQAQALEEAGLIKEASKRKKILAALAGLGVGSGISLGSGLVGSELAGRLFADESIIGHLVDIAKKGGITNLPDKGEGLAKALIEARSVAAPSALYGGIRLGVPASIRTYKAIAKPPKRGFFR